MAEKSGCDPHSNDFDPLMEKLDGAYSINLHSQLNYYQNRAKELEREIARLMSEDPNCHFRRIEENSDRSIISCEGSPKTNAKFSVDADKVGLVSEDERSMDGGWQEGTKTANEIEEIMSEYDGSSLHNGDFDASLFKILATDEVKGDEKRKAERQMNYGIKSAIASDEEEKALEKSTLASDKEEEGELEKKINDALLELADENFNGLRIVGLLE